MGRSQRGSAITEVLAPTIEGRSALESRETNTEPLTKMAALNLSGGRRIWLLGVQPPGRARSRAGPAQPGEGGETTARKRPAWRWAPRFEGRHWTRRFVSSFSSDPTSTLAACVPARRGAPAGEPGRPRRPAVAQKLPCRTHRRAPVYFEVAAPGFCVLNAPQICVDAQTLNRFDWTFREMSHRGLNGPDQGKRR